MPTRSRTTHLILGDFFGVRQAIASEVGRTFLWLNASDAQLHALDCFAPRERNGFNGRQAFGSNQDAFYAAVQLIVEKSVTLIDRYDDHREQTDFSCAVAFPTIVISGLLFEATYDDAAQKVAVKEANHLRLQWTGAEQWALHALVDIVRDVAVPVFAAKRAKDADVLLGVLKHTNELMRKCVDIGSLDPLKRWVDPKDLKPYPRLIQRLQQQIARDARRRGVRSSGVEG
jgi:hypothetical protein